MTINEAHLFVIRATATLIHIPVMTTRPTDTFPAHPETFTGHFGWFPGPFLISSYVFWVSGVIPYI